MGRAAGFLEYARVERDGCVRRPVEAARARCPFSHCRHRSMSLLVDRKKLQSPVLIFVNTIDISVSMRYNSPNFIANR